MRLSRRTWLFGLLGFNAVSAIGGGLALMTGWIAAPSSWFAHTGFNGPYFPGVILFAVVGGSSLLALVSQYRRIVGASLASLLAGTIMLFWITGEIASIRAFDVLQVIYLVTGLAVIALTPTEH